MCDGYSGFAMFFPTADVTAASAARGVLEWISAFGPPTTLVSDRGSHFFSLLMSHLTDVLGLHHHFVVARSPWANGTVEALNRVLLQVLRSLLQEHRLPLEHWPSLLPIVTLAVNNRRSSTRSDFTPSQLFLGRDPVDDLRAALVSGDLLSFDEAAVGTYSQSFAQLRARLDFLHEGSVRSRRRAPPAQSEDLVFNPGDWVLELDVRSRDRSKLSVRKLGPKVVLEPKSAWVYVVCDLDGSGAHEVHAQRLEAYDGGELGITAALRDAVLHQRDAYEVERFVAARMAENGDTYEVLVCWRGFPSDEDRTWQDVRLLAEDGVTGLLVASLQDASFDLAAPGYNRFVKRLLDM